MCRPTCRASASSCLYCSMSPASTACASLEAARSVAALTSHAAACPAAASPETLRSRALAASKPLAARSAACRSRSAVALEARWCSSVFLRCARVASSVAAVPSLAWLISAPAC